MVCALFIFRVISSTTQPTHPNTIQHDVHHHHGKYVLVLKLIEPIGAQIRSMVRRHNNNNNKSSPMVFEDSIISQRDLDATNQFALQYHLNQCTSLFRAFLNKFTSKHVTLLSDFFEDVQTYLLETLNDRLHHHHDDASTAWVREGVLASAFSAHLESLLHALRKYTSSVLLKSFKPIKRVLAIARESYTQLVKEHPTVSSKHSSHNGHVRTVSILRPPPHEDGVVLPGENESGENDDDNSSTTSSSLSSSSSSSSLSSDDGDHHENKNTVVLSSGYKFVNTAQHESFVTCTLLEAEMHYYGFESVAQDLTKALQLYCTIGKFNARAAFQAGVCYEHGFGTPKDAQQSRVWYGVGSSMGCNVCTMHLALCILSWSHERRDIDMAKVNGHEAAEARRLLHRVISSSSSNVRHHHHMDALIALGRLLEMDVPESGLRSNAEEALEAYHRAATLGCTDGAYHYARLQLKQRNPLAVKMMSRVASTGHPDANNDLGRCYEFGLGLSRDLRAAEQCYRRAVHSGHVPARSNLGYVLLLMRRFVEATQLLYDAAEHGDVEAHLHLGAMYFLGIGVPQELTRAVDFFRGASSKGNADATLMLGHAYFEGLGGLPRDLERAKECYVSAATSNVPEAVEHFFRLPDVELDESSVANVRTVMGSEAFAREAAQATSRRWGIDAVDTMQRSIIG
eukprot:PhM_4_TR2835/c0_g1_i1/m.88881/K07126/K07126; uncharacterized protein